MIDHYFISMYLDTRRTKANGKYPLRLRVFTSNPRKQKLYPTAFDFSKKEFKSIWETSKPKREHKSIRLKIQAIENRANGLATKNWTIR